jgi:hypothetical protein
VNVPSGHGVHVSWPCTLENLPGMHAKHCVALLVDENPCSQGVQPVFPVLFANVPDLHSRHAVASAPPVYSPPPQLRHANDSGPGVPVRLPLAANFPGEHDVHVVALFCVEYLPASHPAQANQCVFVSHRLRNPLTHTHCSRIAEAGDTDILGHASQTVPDGPENELGAHGLHAVLPGTDTVPGAHL